MAAEYAAPETPPLPSSESRPARRAEEGGRPRIRRIPRLAQIGLDRKSLSELAIHDPEVFDAIVARVREQLERHDAEVAKRQQNQARARTA